jgi:hypothetical protein
VTEEFASIEKCEGRKKEKKVFEKKKSRERNGEIRGKKENK